MLEPISYGPLVLLAVLVTFLIFFYFRFKHREKLKMMDKGIGLPNSESLTYLKESSLRRGVFIISAGIGLIAAKLLSFYIPILANIASYFGIFCITGGVGLLIYYRISKIK